MKPSKTDLAALLLRRIGARPDVVVALASLPPVDAVKLVRETAASVELEISAGGLAAIEPSISSAVSRLGNLLGTEGPGSVQPSPVQSDRWDELGAQLLRPS